MNYKFTDSDGTFQLENPEDTSYLYLPLVNAAGVMSSITPDGHGDSKLSQEEFLLEPVSMENLHSNAGSRNFWCYVKGYGAWSATGFSALQLAKKYEKEPDACVMTAGQLWQETKRTWKACGLRAAVKSFCPVTDTKAEIMCVTLKNEGKEALTITATAAVPIFARGADHIRDHRHVTALLNRTEVTEDGVVVTPSMAFDERGHHLNQRSYGVFGRSEDGQAPIGAFPVLEEFTGEGGSLLWPEAIVKNTSRMYESGDTADGYEAMGALRFAGRELQPGDSFRYTIVLSYDRQGMEYLDAEKADEAFEQMRRYWKQQKTVSVHTGDPQFDGWMEWVGIQPDLRRIYGCSFLPHHDYGRGGRGWRDLWQDCLALILRNPAQVREDLKNFFAGVRADGSNATIIGSKPGEFKADRNNIVRVWMDHGYWPFFTVKLYLEQTGDYKFLLEENTYFKDQSVHRGEKTDEKYKSSQGNYLLTEDGESYQGTILEHLLIQQITQFYDVGAHNHMRLRGADWNDALDMAKEQGESVAFTAAYSGSMKELSYLLDTMKNNGINQIKVAEELKTLLICDESLYDSKERKQQLLERYCDSCSHNFSGKKLDFPIGEAAEILRSMSCWIQKHIRRTEFVEDKKGNSWFNGYYDNHGKRVEGLADAQVRMMLTSQVFSVLSGTATDEQITKITRSADEYLYDKKIGGYRLNTNFHEVKLDMGRMFGFAYGHKENGAVFSHMAVMYAYALYERGFAREGYQVIRSLFEQSTDFEASRIYPGIPEYFNEKGRGMYSYLTGAASWMVLTVLTQMYGVQGKEGNLVLRPQLLGSQFDEKGETMVSCAFAGRKLEVVYVNHSRKEIGDYEISECRLNGKSIPAANGKAEIPRSEIENQPEGQTIRIRAILE